MEWYNNFMNNTIKLNKPTVNEVEYYLNKWNESDKDEVHDQALKKLFKSTYPLNNDLNEVLIKVASLDSFYSTNLTRSASFATVSRHIVKLNIDKRLNEGDVELVNDIARIKVNGKNKSLYSFATKYCSHHNEDEYTIYDSYVDKVLWYFKGEFGFTEFKRDDLKDFERFKETIIKFRKYFRLEKYSLKKLISIYES